MTRISIFILLVLFASMLFPIETIGNIISHPPKIIDYHPSKFIELADEPFFYSIGNTLRYGRTIDSNSPVIFNEYSRKSDLRNVYVSPDNKKAAFFYDDKLYLVQPAGTAIVLLSNCRDYRHKTIKVGDTYYRNLQWDADSRSIYLIRDKERIRTAHSGFCAPGAALVRIDIDPPTKVVNVINNFNSLHYCFVGPSTICYDYPPGDGSVVWKCMQQGVEYLVTSIRENQIVLANETIVNGIPFLLYDSTAFDSEIWLSRYGFSLTTNTDRTIDFYSKSNLKPIFKIKESGHDWLKDGAYDGIYNSGCRVLPGGRYALLYVYFSNFEGQLLIDGLTGEYRELPAKTKVFLNLNSNNYEYFKFVGPTPNDPSWPYAFLPAAKFRINNWKSPREILGK
jgi:hypothetical protein